MVWSPSPFQALVEDVRRDLDSDTATMLLLNDSASCLEPAAASGLGRLWRGAPHIRVGAGFAGRVAADRSPVLLTELNPANVLNPILRESGVRSLLGVPVEHRGRLLGVLHIGTREGREYGPRDVQRLERHADELAQRLTHDVTMDDHATALALQRSLLPAQPPQVPGLEVAVRYLPADGDLGGDWYDIFHLPGGEVGFVMGDVQGHGLAAAVVMGRLRSALRAYALEHVDPARVLELLDRKLSHFEDDITASVIYAITRPPFEQLVMSSAGHPPPVLALMDQPGSTVSMGTDLLLGVASEQERTNHVVDLPADATLALHTDGLTDARPWTEESTRRRTESFHRALQPRQDAETACARVISQTLAEEALSDDVALLLITRLPG